MAFEIKPNILSGSEPTFRFDPDGFYSTARLQSILEAEGYTLRWFLDKCKPRKFDRSVWIGSDLLEASREYTKRREREAAERQAAAALAHPGRRRKQAAAVEMVPLPTR